MRQAFDDLRCNSDTCVPLSPLQLLAVLLSLFVWLLWLVDWELTELLEVSYVSLEFRPTKTTSIYLSAFVTAQLILICCPKSSMVLVKNYSSYL